MASKVHVRRSVVVLRILASILDQSNELLGIYGL